MTLDDAIELAHVNKGHIYTTDSLWENNENCILVDNLGNLIYGDGEPISDIDELEQDGWYDITDEEPQLVDDIECNVYKNKYIVGGVLWDDEDF